MSHLQPAFIAKAKQQFKHKPPALKPDPSQYWDSVAELHWQRELKDIMRTLHSRNRRKKAHANLR